MSTTILHGGPVADRLRADVSEAVERLRDRGTVPRLGTVLMSDDPAGERFMDLKHDACGAVGIETLDRRLDPAAPSERLYRAVADLSTDRSVHAVFVQTPLPGHVDPMAVRKRVDPSKDVDCFHPGNLGRLVAGDPRFVPATPAAVLELLDCYDVELPGRNAVVVGRTTVIGRPLAHLLLARDATVTVCHSRTGDLGAVTRRGDVVVTAAGRPELVDGDMLAPGVVVVDVSANRRQRADGDANGSRDGDGNGESGVEGTGPEVVGDVDFESARNVAGAVTPVPGGVGPVTLATLLGNVVRAAGQSAVSDT